MLRLTGLTFRIIEWRRPRGLQLRAYVIIYIYIYIYITITSTPFKDYKLRFTPLIRNFLYRPILAIYRLIVVFFLVLPKYSALTFLCCLCSCQVFFPFRSTIIVQLLSLFFYYCPAFLSGYSVVSIPYELFFKI